MAVMVTGLLKLPWEKVPESIHTLISGQNEGAQGLEANSPECRAFELGAPRLHRAQRWDYGLLDSIDILFGNFVSVLYARVCHFSIFSKLLFSCKCC